MAAVYLDYHKDAALIALAEANAVHLQIGQATSFADVTTRSAGSASFSAGDGNGKFTIGAGTGTARRLSVGAEADVSVNATGTVDHVAYVDTVNSRYWIRPAASGVAVNNGETVDIGAHVVDQTVVS